MTSLIWVAIAVVLARWTDRADVRLVALLIACIGGTTLPDVDFLLPLTHRSALTHSVLPALLLWWWPRARPIAAGVAVGIGLHLAADCFPNGMTGYATIKLPLFGSIGGGPSYAWLAANAVLAMGGGTVGAAEGLSPLRRLILLAGFAAIGASYLFVTDGGWPPLAIFAVAGWLAVRRRKAARTA